jgi:hypothetical protein
VDDGECSPNGRRMPGAVPAGPYLSVRRAFQSRCGNKALPHLCTHAHEDTGFRQLSSNVGKETSMKKLTMTAALCLAFAYPVVTQAEALKVKLTGYQETPQSLSTPGFADFEASISEGDSSITWQMTYGGTPTAVTQSHIHFGQRSIGGGISIFLCSNLGNGPAGTQPCPAEGTIGGTIFAENVIGPAGQGIGPGELSEIISAIRAGYAYVNIHTTAFPAGELRGQFSDRPGGGGQHGPH